MKNTLSPVTWVPTVYFAMGLPFVILSMVSVLMFSDMGISNTRIAFWTSLVLLPWSLKPLWSAFLEMYKSKKYFVVLTQLVSGTAFALLALSLHLPDFFAWAIALMGLIALSGATHDIAGDGVYMSELAPQQQARFIGWQGAFYNLAKILANGALVFLAGVLKDTYGVVAAWSIIMWCCAALMVVVGLYHLRVLPHGGSTVIQVHNFGDAFKGFRQILSGFFTKRYIGWYLLFIIMYRFAEGLAMKIVPLFLKAPRAEGGLGLTTQDIGLVYGTFGVVAFILGSVLAGYYISAFGLRKVLFTLCCIFNIPFAVYFVLALWQPDNLWWIGGAIVFEYFGYGFGFVGLTLFIMQQIAPGPHQMSHYAFATAIMNLGVMLPGMVSGWLSEALGYQHFFMWVLPAAVPAFIITWFIRRTIRTLPQ